MLQKDKPLGSEPWFNPEQFTAQKREWLDARKMAAQDGGGVDGGSGAPDGSASPPWPQHLYERLYVVGLPPDMELSGVAEQLCGAFWFCCFGCCCCVCCWLFIVV